MSDIIEAFFDTKTENEFVKNLPVVGWLVKSAGVVDKLKTKFLVNTILKFLKIYQVLARKIFVHLKKNIYQIRKELINSANHF